MVATHLICWFRKIVKRPHNSPVPERVGPEPIFVPEFLELLQHENDQIRERTYHAV